MKGTIYVEWQMQKVLVFLLAEREGVRGSGSDSAVKGSAEVVESAAAASRGRERLGNYYVQWSPLDQDS